MEKIQSWPPTYLSPNSALQLKNSRGYDVIDFAETLCRITEDSIAGSVGEKLVLRPWQKELLINLYARYFNYSTFSFFYIYKSYQKSSL